MWVFGEGSLGRRRCARSNQTEEFSIVDRNLCDRVDFAGSIGRYLGVGIWLFPFRHLHATREQSRPSSSRVGSAAIREQSKIVEGCKEREEKGG